jgi:hypothetical protein
MKKLNNTVIKNLSPEMGKRIIAKYQADGWDTMCLSGANSEEDRNTYIYYGVIGGHFDNHSLNQVTKANARIIDLEDEFIPNRGDMVMVFGSCSIEPSNLIYLTTIEGAEYPIVCVYPTDNQKFIEGQAFRITNWKHMKPITKPDPKADIKAQIQAQYEIMQKLINKT